MKIYGDRSSGNCLKVKYTCDHLGLAYDWINVDIMKNESRTPDEPYIAVCRFHVVYLKRSKDTRDLLRVQRGEAALKL